MMCTDTPETFYRRYGKRLFDLAIAVPVTIAAAPVLLLVGLLIRLESRGAALFSQERLGRHARPFRAYKYRTMIDRRRVPDTDFYRGDPSEITRIGRILRRTKLDELPQLLNVVRGDMSIVGPRPQLPVQLKDFDANAKLRLLVRPGLTGMAQTHGNVALSWPERWHYDAEYVKHLSFVLDVRLIFRTVAVLLLGEERFMRRPLNCSDHDELGK
jgi:undecaprenyl phosphate N,N'-diacetylbacillosamine 1-phosphate transferase